MSTNLVRTVVVVLENHRRRRRKLKLLLVGFVQVWCCFLAFLWYWAIDSNSWLNILDETWLDWHQRPCQAMIDEAFAQICTGYRTGKFVGTLCEPLCDQQQSKTKLELLDCPNQSSHNGKDCVIFGQIIIEQTNHKSPQKLALKSRVFTLEELLGISYEDFVMNPQLLQYLNKTIPMLLSDRIDNFTLTNHEKLLQLIAPFDLIYGGDLDDGLVVNLTNLWFLIQDNEYVLSKTRESSWIFPRVLGSCGHFYAVEFVSEIVDWTYFVPPIAGFQIRSTSERIQLALDLIQFLRRFQSSYPKLELCDVKFAHFGYLSTSIQHHHLNHHRHLVLLDSDMIYPIETVRLSIENEPRHCIADSECHFIDCNGICDRTTGRCRPDPFDNDLRRICRNLLFIGNIFPILKGLNLGLLTEIETKSKIEIVKKLCFDDDDRQLKQLNESRKIELIENILIELIN